MSQPSEQPSWPTLGTDHLDAQDHSPSIPEEPAQPTQQQRGFLTAGDRAQGAFLTDVNRVPVPSSEESSLSNTRPTPNLSHPFVQVPGYDILQELGHGGMGVVYRARQRSLNRIVALKMIRSSMASAEDLQRFQIEAEVIAHLQHPNVVQIFEIGEHHGQPWFSLELVSGGSLADYLQHAPLTSKEAALLVARLADALHLAHQHHVIHRDLKPANVLLTEDGTPKVTDFGLAKRLNDSLKQTRTGMFMGTPSYVAPEQAACEPGEMGPQTDIYSLGAILYEILTGRPPFLGSDLGKLLDQVRFKDPISPSHLNLGVPRDLEVICLKCLQKEPHHRYQTAQELKLDLERWLRGEQISARPPSPWTVLKRWVKRRPALAGLWTAVTLMLVLAVLGVIFHVRTLEAETRETKRRAEREVLDRINAQKLAERKNFIALRLEQARSSLNERDGDIAFEKAKEAEENAKKHPILPKLLQQALHLQQRAKRIEMEQAKFQKFHGLCSQSLFHIARFSGRASHLDRKDVLESTGKALELFPSESLASSTLTRREQNEIRERRYEMLLLRADVFADQGNAVEALQLLNKASELGFSTRAWDQRYQRWAKKSPPAQAHPTPRSGAMDHFLVGKDAYFADRLTDALNELRQALDADPKHVWALYFQALCHLRMHRPGEARVALQQLRRDIDSPWVMALLGVAHSQMGDHAQAEVEFARVLNITDEDWIRAATLINRGVARLRAGKLPESVSDLEEALKIDQHHYRGWANLARAHQEQWQWQLALESWNQAIGIEPEMASLYRGRAQMTLARIHVQNWLPHEEKEKQQWTTQAEADLTRAIELENKARHPERVARDLIQRARLQIERGLIPPAIADGEQARELDSRSVDAHLLLGELRLQQNELRKALTSLAEGIALAQPGEQLLRAYLLRAKVLSELREDRKALSDYQTALSLDPENRIALVQRGWLYLRQQAPKLAGQDFTQAMKLGTTSPEVWMGRSLARMSCGQHRDAISDAERALQNEKLSPLMRYHGARVFAMGFARLQKQRMGTPAQTKALRERYQERALSLLQRALRDCPTAEIRAKFWQKHVAGDAVWSGWHSHTIYRQLSWDYGKKSRL